MTLDTGSEFAGYTLGERRSGASATMSFLARRTGEPQETAHVLDVFDDDRTATTVRRSETARRITAASRLEHPGFAAILDSGTTDGRVWSAREHVDAAEPGRLPVERALAVVTDAAAALDHAHSRGVLHRNLSTDTLLVTDTRTVLTDVGTPRSEHRVSATALAYTAPEQLDGHAVDHRADVYALGGLLHRLLTGTAPFVRDTPAAVVRAHLTELPPRPSAAGLPRRLDAVIARAMAKSPDDRYDSCVELVDAAAIALRPNRSRVGAVWLPVAVVAVIAIAVGAVVGVRSNHPQPQPTVPVPVAAREPQSSLERVQGVSGTATYDVMLPRFGEPRTPAQRVFDDAMRAALRRQADADAGRPFTLTGDRSDVVHEGERVISGALVTDWAAPGAAPTTLVATTVVDSVTARPITLADLFTDLDAGLARLSAAAAQQLPTAPTDGIAPTEDNFANWLATPAGVLLRFDAGQVAPTDDGPVDLTVPWAELADVVAPATMAVVTS